MIGKTVSHYRILEKLGVGGMGVVYKTEDTRLGRFVALKFLPDELARDPQAVERFQLEARAASALNHPNICTIYDIGEQDGKSFIAMELLEGQTLKEAIQAGPLKIADVIELTSQIADALEKAHARGIIHRDLKPANIFVTSDRKAKILDFGLAKIVLEKGLQPDGRLSTLPTVSPENLTSPGVALGTVAYMSPEQARSEELDARTDLFSLGVVLYEMVTAQRAFSGTSMALIFDAILNRTPTPPVRLNPELPAEMERIIVKALDKDRDLRYQNASELKTDLKRLKRALDTGNTESTVSVKLESLPAAPPRSRTVPAVFAVAGLIAFMAALGYIVFYRGAPPLEISILETKQLSFEPGLEMDPSLSPDGKMVAYAAGTSARMDIHVRQLAGGDPIVLTKELPGSHRWPKWAPDGTRIAFLSNSSTGNSIIYIVPSLGGIPKEFVRVPSPTLGQGFQGGHAWSPDGTQMAYSNNRAIYVQPLNGGEPKQVVDTNEPHSVSWSPDGSRLLYVSGNTAFTFGINNLANVAPSSVAIISVAGGTPIPLTENTALNTSPLWMTSGDAVLYLSSQGGNRDVYHQRLDASGKPLQPPKRLTTGLGAHTISLSADGKSLAYSVLTSKSNIWSLPIPENGPVSASGARPVTAGNQAIEGISVSADGSWLAFDSNRSGNQDIYRMLRPSGTPEQITNHPSDDFLPAWSPDGQSIAFYSFRNGNRDLYVMSADGRQTEQLTADRAEERYPEWSPHGKEIVFYSDKSGIQELYVIALKNDGPGWDAPRQLSKGGGLYPKWSPDGEWIAYIQEGLRLVSPRNGQERLLVPRQAASAPQFAAWSKDSRTIYFKAYDSAARSSFWSVATAGGEPRQLVRFDDPSRQSTRSEFASDGKDFLFTMTERESDLWVATISP